MIPIESLVKCKMQDNLEFLQWTKRYWDQYFPGHDYDAVGRRKAAGTAAPTGSMAPRASAGTSAARKPATSSAPRTGARTGSAAGGAAVGAGAATMALRQENETMKEAIAGLEKERDFYFSKLRDIELLLQTAIEQDPEIEKDDNGLVRNIQTILYSTEDGFEIPAEAEEGANGDEPDTF
jgi:microtubule-associated protein, RP/EB family